MTLASGQRPLFVTAIYGADYLAFLTPHLASVRAAHPEAEELVLWHDLPAAEIALHALAFPSCRFAQLDEPILGGLHERIPRKLRAWKRACAEAGERTLCFIDCDTLLVRPLGEYLAPPADAVFTWKDGPFPVNTGVMILRGGAPARAFLDDWEARTERITQDPARLAEALAASGAADQHAFREILGADEFGAPVTRRIAGQEIVFQGAPCAVLNETRSVPISAPTRIVHYKGGWHPIILGRSGFSENRPEATSAEMLRHWKRASAEADRSLAREALFRAAEAAREDLARAAGDYEERGILHSEMLAVCGVCRALNIDLLIESGRCRGQSTAVLGAFFEGSATSIVSFELERNEDAAIAEARCAPFKNLSLLYGDSRRAIPELLRESRGRRIALLLDGPKGQAAFDLAKAALGEGSEAAAIFFHDARRGSIMRGLAEAGFARAAFTDDAEYVAAFGALDDRCLPRDPQSITPHTWRPYMKGEDKIESYGPTLAVVFPKRGEAAAAPAPNGGGGGLFSRLARAIRGGK